MIDFSLIPFTEQAKALIQESVSNYWRFARIEVTMVPSEKPCASIIHISQKELVNNKILTGQELIDRGKNIFEGLIPETYQLFYVPHEFVG